VKRGDHRSFRDCRDQTIFHRRRGCDAQPLTIQAPFAEELAGLSVGGLKLLHRGRAKINQRW